MRWPRLLLCFLLLQLNLAGATDVGVYYFPGWNSNSSYWNDLKGLQGSRSPGIPWPDREPLLGYYSEEQLKVAEQHVEWASQYGITFFAYDWYWNGQATYLNHALDNFLKAPNNSKMKFALLWANHSDAPKSLREFDDMVAFWLKRYLAHPQYYRINAKPVVFVFADERLQANSKRFGWSSNALLQRATETARAAGLPGIFFVATTNSPPSDRLENRLLDEGFSAYSGWNYVVSKDKSQSADYQSMVDTYTDYYDKARKTKGALAYIPPVSPGWDSRPWHGAAAVVRNNATPAKFGRMLHQANALADSGRPGVLDVVMIEAWNEFGEGAYIEPTKKWGFQYLETVRAVFRGAPR